MILVDSSAWIEYYRKDGKPAVQAAVAEAIRKDEAASNAIVLAEILPFVRGDKDLRRVQSDFSAFHWIDLTRESADLAVALGRKLRRRGLTVPATDLLVAASALHAGASLLHADSHFQAIAKEASLDCLNPLGL